MPILVDSQGKEIISNIECAKSLFARGFGLIGRKNLSADRGFWIEPCNGVHTFGMRFALDVIYLKADGEVLRLFEWVQPNRLCPLVKGTRAVLELPAGAIALYHMRVGNRYYLEM